MINKKIHLYELTALIILITAVKGADMTSSILFPLGKNATWMFPIIWLIFMAPPFIALIYVLNYYKNKNLIEIIYIILGKYLGFFINFLLFFILYFAIVIDSRSYIDSLNIMVFRNSSLIYIYVIVISTSYLLAKNGIVSLTRTSLIIIPMIFFSVILLTVLTFYDYRIEHLFPITGPGMKDVIFSGITHSSLIGEFLLIGVFITYVDSIKTYIKANLIGFVIGCFIISLLLAEYVLMFDYFEVQNMLQPFSQICRLTNIGIYISSLDAVFFGACIVVGFIRFAFYIYGSSTILCNTLKIDKIDKLILPISFSSIILGIIPNNPTKTSLILRASFLKDGLWAFFWILPIILLLIIKISGDKKNGTNI